MVGKFDESIHRHSVPTNKSSRPHNGIFLLVRPYKVVTVRSDFHGNLSGLKNVFFPLGLVALRRICPKYGARYALVHAMVGKFALSLSKNLKTKIYRNIILSVVLYGCETWSLTLREVRRLRVFENRDEVTG